ncbi:MAG: hypothetical protein ACXVD8_11450 [Actinomycetota bacterium]
MKRARLLMTTIAVLTLATAVVHASGSLPPVGSPVVSPSATPPAQIGTLDRTHALLAFSGRSATRLRCHW